MTMYHLVILCGGEAIRLQPISKRLPKSLFEINGKPFIDYQLEIASRQKFKSVVLCTGYLGDKIEEYLGNNKFGLDIKYSNDGEELLGTGGAVKNAFWLLADNFFVMYGDSYLEFDYSIVQYVYSIKEKLALMTVYKNDDNFDKSNVEYRNNKIVQYDKDNNTHRMTHIDYGAGIFNKKAFDGFDDNFSLQDVYRKMLKQDQLSSFVVKNRFYQIGTFNGIKELEFYLKEKNV